MRMRSRALLVLLLCSLLAGAANAEPSPDPTYKDCHPGDKAALLAFKAALGEAYHFASWTPDNPCCDCGAIPASLGTIPNLSGINLSRNRLTGAIPPMFLSKSADQVYLWLSHNNLTGPVPAGFAAVNFAHLDLSRNDLTGDASGLFGRGKELQYIDLSRNDFDFDLSGVVLPEQLYFVDVSHNAIHGSIPAQVASLSNLQFFNVSYNRLCGPVPTGGNMERFDLYNFQHNKCLCGAPLPACKK
ncbi:Polygalacturonase inhibitor [Triticum urartu]|uniref:Polygalacturonase inhibitor n=1 Tax=Triticum urartu TaxID=4572 RepID=M8ARE1_TRIUA|nr:Polygalacturonase inhibitor [Triticum urartu]